MNKVISMNQVEKMGKKEKMLLVKKSNRRKTITILKQDPVKAKTQVSKTKALYKKMNLHVLVVSCYSQLPMSNHQKT